MMGIAETVDVKMLLAIYLVVTFLSANCYAKVYETLFDHVTWNDERWQLTTTYLDPGHYQSRMSLANGYLGINVAAAGPFFEVDQAVNGDVIGGWPLFDRRQTFATIAGFFASEATTNGTNFPWLLQYGGESVIAGIPHWSGILVESEGYVLNASVPSSQISGFNSTLAMKDGLQIWSYTWTPPKGPALNIEYKMLVHKLYVNMAAVELSITAEENINVTIIDVMNGDCAVRSEYASSGYEENAAQIWSSVHPHWQDGTMAYVYSTLVGDSSLDLESRTQFTDATYIGGNQSSIAQAAIVQLKAGTVSTITKFIGAASSDAFDDPLTLALDASNAAADLGFARMLDENTKEWSQIMPPDSVDDYKYPDVGTLKNDSNIVTLQITAVTNPFNLIQNTIGANAIQAADNNKKLDIWSIPVGGLGSSSYAGWIFWDAEVWMAPGLVVSNPQAAKQIANYRVQQFPQAQANVKTSFQASTNNTQFTSSSAVFPWVSGKFGNCTAAGPCFDYEYHLNGDIGLELVDYYVVTGDVKFFEKELFPIYDAIASLYSELLIFNDTTGSHWLKNATDPDEYANFVDNPAFTQALIQTHLTKAIAFRKQFGFGVNETWGEQASTMAVPVNIEAGLILEYQGMNGTISVKQADVVLVDDFLNFPNPYSINDLDYYAGKQSLNGPGMTYGVYSIVANEISPSGCSAHTYNLYGSEPYIRAPWFQYSEQLIDDYGANGGTHPAYPFLTGMGGANRVGIFGYLGLRLSLESLNVDPNLPPQIPYIRHRTFYWQGWAISAYSNQTHTTITRLARSLATANPVYATSRIPVTVGLNTTSVYPLPVNGTVVVTNRQIGFLNTYAGNVAQCKPVTSPQGYLPGQFPLSAVDGAASTKWQPVTANTTSEIVVQLEPPFVPIVGFRFDWAQTPPLEYHIAFSNKSFDGSTVVQVTSSTNITVSSPYVASAAAEIVQYSGNTTNVSLEVPVWSGRYARLQIKGATTEEYSVNGTGSGATVAEWGIIQQDGGNAALAQPARRELRQPQILESSQTRDRRYSASDHRFR